jgi:hypothetical protein
MALILSGDTGVPASGMPTGSVIQTVTNSTQNNNTTSSSSFVTTGFYASITPTSSTSKILILLSGPVYCDSTGTEAYLTVYRGATNLNPVSQGFTDTYSSAGRGLNSVSIAYLDSPATTSSTTYTIYYKVANGGNIYFPANSNTASLVLQEIKA